MPGRSKNEAVVRAQAMLVDVRGRELSEAELVAKCVDVAGALLQASHAEASRAERARAALLAELVEDARGQAFSTLLTDRVYRSRDPARIVDASRHLLRTLGIPRYLPPFDRAKLRALLHAGPFVPEVAARGVLAELQRQTKNVVLSAEPEALTKLLAARAEERVHVNLNQLGEAVLGEHEAETHLRDYLGLIERPDVEAISVKLSSITSRVDVLAFDATLDAARSRLRTIYRAALTQRFQRADGSHVPKLVSLDMEAYRDLQLTFALFTTLLDEPELRELRACIVLQAYLPDSFALQRALTAWATKRVAAGGAPVRLRIVKGANLAAERVEASARGWELPMFGSKTEVDANYKRMVEYGCMPEHARAVQLGIASHNVFDIAFGLVQRARHAVEEHVGFELLEGMADPLERTLREVAGDVLVYCPAALPGSMQSAIAYLMRRLDENTSPENFLRKSFAMRAGDTAWQGEQQRFEQACELRATLSDAPRRTQDRSVEPAGLDVNAAFVNEPDTDFALEQNRRWITEILDTWRTRERFDVSLRVGGRFVFGESRADGFDPSRPGHVPYRFALATEADIALALDTAERSKKRVVSLAIDERGRLLSRIAHGLRRERGQLIAAMVLDAGKRVEQADAEVSEAIDFAEYYARTMAEHVALEGLSFAPKGCVLITPPWNFPLAIPAGGVFAALAAGNCVLLKPALETVLVAERLARVCWDAGVDAEALQLVLCEDELGSRLIRDERVNTVVLTGATSTAKLFETLRPRLDLLAETGGKNAVVISAMADRDQAIKDVLHGAFGHAGQKCSATSLLICEAEVYDDPTFRAVLADAVKSLPVGSAWDLRSVVTPLIAPPSGALQRALTTLEPSESWLVEPRFDVDNPRLVSPGVKLDVQPGSFTHVTELFGPVLGVMRADDLDDAIAKVNATPYGLTSGLFSLDEREQLRWSERVHAGNLYVNRATTGAIVRRQPFGGMKASSFGPGAKAGGPNYVLELCRITEHSDPSVVDVPLPDAATFLGRVKRFVAAPDHRHLASAACRYAHAVRSHFALEHDPSRVLGERNRFRYKPIAPLIVRASHDAVIGDALLAVVAGLSVGAAVVLSMHPALLQVAPWLSSLPLITFAAEDAAACAQRLQSNMARVRLIGSLEAPLAAAAAQSGVHIAQEPVLMNGRIELLHYVREQSLSVSFHRNGSLETERLSPWPDPQTA